MKKNLVAFLFVLIAFTGYSQTCGPHDYQCKAFIDSVNVNGSVTMCFAQYYGINDLGGGNIVVPPIDSSYIKVQGNKGFAQFVSPTCIRFDAANFVGTAQIIYVVIIADSCHTQKECFGYVSIVPPSWPIAVADTVNVIAHRDSNSIDVLRNDIDSTNTYALYLSKQPSHGVVSVVNKKLNFSYFGSYLGGDTFSYELCNLYNVCKSALVYLTIDSCVANCDTQVVSSIIDNDVLRQVNIYPNPSNGNQFLSFELLDADYLSISFFDALGREVKLLADKKWFCEGKHIVPINENSMDTTGVCFVKIQTKENTKVYKVMR